MIHVYNTSGSEAARDLVGALNALAVDQQGPMARVARNAQDLSRAERGHLIVGWGETIPPVPAALTVVNPSMGTQGKFAELQALARAGVRVPVHSRNRDGAGMLGRRNNHMGGHDLLRPPEVPDYYVEKLDLRNEYRVHVFNGRSIRLGKRVHRQRWHGDIHPWIRSDDAGWKHTYGDEWRRGPEGGAAFLQSLRDAAKAAVAALGLHFGAVDLGVTPQGVVYALEVNRAPGLEGGTALIYAEKLREVAANPAHLRAIVPPRQPNAVAPAREAVGAVPAVPQGGVLEAERDRLRGEVSALVQRVNRLEALIGEKDAALAQQQNLLIAARRVVNNIRELAAAA